MVVEVQVEVEVEVEVEMEVEEKEKKKEREREREKEKEKEKRMRKRKRSHQYPSQVIHLRGSRPQGQLVVFINQGNCYVGNGTISYKFSTEIPMTHTSCFYSMFVGGLVLR